MDRKLLFYLLGSVEDTFSKLTLRSEVVDQLTPNIRFNLDVAMRHLEGLRRSVAKEYVKIVDFEGAPTPVDTSME